MSIELIVILAFIVLLGGMILYLKVPAFAVLFSLLIGQVLSSQASQDAYGFFAGVSGVARYEYVQIILLVLPMILTMVFLRGRAKHLKPWLEFLPAVLSGVLLVALAYVYVPVVKTAVDIATEDTFTNFGSAVVVITAMVGLASLWLSVPKPKSKEGKKH